MVDSPASFFSLPSGVLVLWPSEDVVSFFFILLVRFTAAETDGRLGLKVVLHNNEWSRRRKREVGTYAGEGVPEGTPSGYFPTNSSIMSGDFLLALTWLVYGAQLARKQGVVFCMIRSHGWVGRRMTVDGTRAGPNHG